MAYDDLKTARPTQRERRTGQGLAFEARPGLERPTLAEGE